MYTLDDVLHLLSILSWTFFIIFAIVLFVRTALRYGIVRAILQLLSTRVLLPLLIVFFISFLSAALVFVPPTHVGVVVSYISPGGIRPQPLRAGLHLIIPIVEMEYQYPIYWQTYTMSNKVGEGEKTTPDSIRARTSDGQEVSLDSSVIYRVNPDQAVSIHTDWQDRYTEDFVRPVIRGFVRTEASQFTVQEVNSDKRKDLEVALQRRLSEEFSNKGIVLDQFLIRDVEFTEEYARSIEDKQVALEGVTRTESEAEQVRNLAEGEKDRIATEAEGNKQRFILEAEGKAQSIKLESEAQADALKLIAEALNNNQDLLTYQYIDKLSPSIRAMLVPNNAPLILPLQGLMEELEPVVDTYQSVTRARPITTTTTLSSTNPSTNPSTEEDFMP